MKKLLSLFFGFLLFGGISAIDCPAGTIASFSGDTCLLLVGTSLDFITADKYCQNNGGHLSSIHNGFDNLYITDQAKKQFTGAESFIVGGNNLQSHTTWTWIDGTPFDFTDWGNCKLL